MADLFPLNNLLDGTKKLFIALMGKKSDLTYEAIKTNDAGAVKVSVADSVPAGTNLIGKTVPVDADGDEKFTSVNPAVVTLSGSRISVDSHGAFAVAAAAVSKAITNRTCTVNVLSGAVWINPNAVAVADATAIKVTGAIDLFVVGNLSLISDATGASVQIIVWE